MRKRAAAAVVPDSPEPAVVHHYDSHHHASPHHHHHHHHHHLHQSYSGPNKRQRTEQHCAHHFSELPTTLKLHILSYLEFNFHHVVDLSLDIGHNRTRVMRQLFGFFRNDHTRTIRLLFPTLNIACGAANVEEMGSNSSSSSSSTGNSNNNSSSSGNRNSNSISNSISNSEKMRHLLPRCGQVRVLRMCDAETSSYESMIAVTGRNNQLAELDLTPKHLVPSLLFLAHVKHQTLRKLRLSVPLSSWCLTGIAEHAREVRDLEITLAPGVTNLAFSVLSRLTRLEELQFDVSDAQQQQQQSGVGALSLVPLASLTRLRVLVLPEREVVDWSTLPSLATGLLNLTDLFVYNLRDTEASVVAQMRTVTRLICRASRVSVVGVEELLSMTNLKKFALYNDNEIKSHHLRRITALQQLRFIGTNHSSTLFFHYLNSLPHLTSIYLYNVHVTQDAMDLVLAHSNLRRLELDEINGLTPVFFDRLLELNTSLEALGVQCDDANSFTARASVLKGHPTLHTLILKNLAQSLVFAELLQSKSLETLHISVPQILDNVLQALASNSTLKYLSILVEEVVEDAVFHALVTHPTLEHISLDATLTPTYLDHGALTRVNHCHLKRVKSFQADCYKKGIQFSHFEFDGYEL